MCLEASRLKTQADRIGSARVVSCKRKLLIYVLTTLVASFCGGKRTQKGVSRLSDSKRQLIYKTAEDTAIPHLVIRLAFICQSFTKMALASRSHQGVRPARTPSASRSSRLRLMTSTRAVAGDCVLQLSSSGRQVSRLCGWEGRGLGATHT